MSQLQKPDMLNAIKEGGWRVRAPVLIRMGGWPMVDASDQSRPLQIGRSSRTVGYGAHSAVGAFS